jgi:hypothetical protein
MMKLVEVEVVLGSDVSEKRSINPSKVWAIKVSDSSGKGGMPECCVLTMDDGTILNVKGTVDSVHGQLARTLVEVEVILGSDLSEKRWIDPSKVQSVKASDSSAKGGMPECCVLTMANGSSVRAKGTVDFVNGQLRGGA